MIRAFGITVDDEFTKVPARQIEAPELEYSNSRKVRPFKGTWRVANFLEPSKLLDWTLINLDYRTRPDTLSKFGQDVSCFTYIIIYISQINGRIILLPLLSHNQKIFKLTNFQCGDIIVFSVL